VAWAPGFPLFLQTAVVLGVVGVLLARSRSTWLRPWVAALLLLAARVAVQLWLESGAVLHAIVVVSVLCEAGFLLMGARQFRGDTPRAAFAVVVGVAAAGITVGLDVFTDVSTAIAAIPAAVVTLGWVLVAGRCFWRGGRLVTRGIGVALAVWGFLLTALLIGAPGIDKLIGYAAQADLTVLIVAVAMLQMDQLAAHQLAAEQRVARVLERSEEGLFRARPGAGLTFVSPTLMRMMGAEHEDELLNWPLEDFLMRETPALIEPVAGLEGLQVRMRRLDHRPIRVELRIWWVDYDGDRLIEGLIRDVTEQHRISQRLEQASKMESLGRLAGGVAHDFNNLLTVIGGNADILADEVEPDLQPVVEAIQQAGDRAGSMTRQLLAFSRKQPLQPRTIDLGRKVQETQNLVQRLVSEDVRVDVSVGTGEHLVRVDPGQLEQVLLNLVTNAVEAMPGGGEIHLGVRQEDEWVELQVVDTGMGMDEETARRVFEPFYTTKDTGTGLGLATVFGVVSQSGGTVTVESSMGAGTCFRVRLPRSTQPAEEISVLAAAESQKALAVLMLEDHLDVAEVLVRMLRLEGHRVTHFSSGQAALDADLPQPDIILSDIRMPGMSGPMAVRELQSRWPEAGVIFMTGYSQTGPLVTSGPVLRKPFTRRELGVAVQEALQERVG
jgi:signal transduction histidine kinase/CheY-like chemotaxis protein